MNTSTSIRKLLEKFVQNDCSQEEIKQVVNYFRKTTSTNELPTVEDVLKLLKEPPEMEKEKANEIYDTIISTAAQRGKGRTIGKLWKYAAAAAVFVGILTIAYFFQQKPFDSHREVLVPTNEAITLQLENGKLEIISEDGEIQVIDAVGNVVGRQKGNQLVYDNETDAAKLAYNTLIVPYGKRFEVLLSDGSKAYLNAGTSLKYPVRFIQGENRQVFLKGEAFFDVAKDSEHPFIVNADHLNVQVLGTEFNVSNYAEDPQSEVVLVEGAVRMYEQEDAFNPEKGIVLNPGTKGSFDKNDRTIETKEVVTKVYTSWINDELVFRNMTFDNILKKLERHYSITIINNNKDLGQEEFNASFGNNTIEYVLQSLETTYGIEYTIKDNKVIIK